MANTPNLDLIKPLGTDHALVSQINSNMDKIDQYAGGVDASLGAIEDGIAIVANGDTHAAITSGQFVYVRNHSTLTQGLYTATANIAANATLSTSNLTADPSGGLNALNSKTTKVQSVSIEDCSTIESIFTTLLASPNMIGVGNIGDGVSTNLKTLLGNPLTNASWVSCSIQLLSLDSSGNGMALCTAWNQAADGANDYRFLSKQGNHYGSSPWQNSKIANRNCGEITSEGHVNVAYPSSFEPTNCFVAGTYVFISNTIVFTSNIDVLMGTQNMDVYNHTGNTAEVHVILQKY